MTLSRRSPPLAPNTALAELPPRSVLGQKARLLARIVGAVAWTLPCAAIQAVLLRLPGHGKRWLARRYWAGLCRILGIERRVLGTLPTGGRPVLFVSNHTSWLDVPVLGATLEASFVAKAEVRTWPIVRTIAYLGRTVFVSRKAAETVRERNEMQARLDAGDALILFPEGTSSDGARVLPFRSAFFAIAEPRPGARPPLIQPVSIVFDRLDYLPARRSTRPVTSWYGDMELGSHFRRLAQHRHLRATIHLHAPIDPTNHPSRKTLAQTVATVIVAGNVALRTNRPA